MAGTEPTATLDDLCKGAGFGRIVYVDDFFDRSPARIESLIAERSPTELRSIEVLQLGDTGDDFIHDAAKTAARKITEPAQVETLFEELAAKVEGTDASDADHIAVSAFKGVLGNIAPGSVRQLSMGQWKNQRDILTQEAAGDAVTLFIFDDDFSLEGLGTDAGRSELQWIRTKLAGKRHATVLLTHGAATEDAEQGIEQELRTADTASGFRTVVISKEPLQRGTSSLVRRVKYALLQDQFVDLKGKVRAAMSAAAQSAIAALEQMGVDEFERIIVHSSLTEGAWCPDTVTRVIWVGQEKAVRRSLRTDQTVHDLVTAIEPLARLRTGEVTPAVVAQASRLQHLEVVDSATDMDGLFLPLDLGDIFEFKQRRYVLIAQSCDLAIRSNGKRNRDEDRVVALVELQATKVASTPEAAAPAAAAPAQAAAAVPSPKGSSTPATEPLAGQPLAAGEADGCTASSCSTNDERAFTIANGNLDGTALTVLFDRVMYVPIWLLDLTVISPGGACELTSATTASGALQASWRARLPELQGRVKKEVVSLYRAVMEQTPKPTKAQPATGASTGAAAATPPLKEQERNRLLRSLIRIPEGCKFQPSVEFGASESWTFKVDGLKRVQRIRERHATPLLIAFMQYAARPAYPHELTRMSLPDTGG
ncbi:MAG: hypothetical protein KF745_10395 [Phycisphaeraceae bacterium]|nr:hypothetical protein [Phycisphaeraceae bacterium]